LLRKEIIRRLIQLSAFNRDDYGASQAWCQTLELRNWLTVMNFGLQFLDQRMVAVQALERNAFFNFLFDLGVDRAFGDSLQRYANFVFMVDQFVFQNWSLVDVRAIKFGFIFIFILFEGVFWFLEGVVFIVEAFGLVKGPVTFVVTPSALGSAGIIVTIFFEWRGLVQGPVFLVTTPLAFGSASIIIAIFFGLFAIVEGVFWFFAGVVFIVEAVFVFE